MKEKELKKIIKQKRKEGCSVQREKYGYSYVDWNKRNENGDLTMHFVPTELKAKKYKKYKPKRGMLFKLWKFKK